MIESVVGPVPLGSTLLSEQGSESRDRQPRQRGKHTSEETWKSVFVHSEKDKGGGMKGGGTKGRLW